MDKKYVKTSIETRFKEHMAHLKNGRTDRSIGVVQHTLKNKHRTGIGNLKLNYIYNKEQLDVFESLIFKYRTKMNSDTGFIPNS